jgi:2-keto-4-pentenoate hydratase/2-oxohepta-3-ene-1,7-dioic acid hydratase in catechol pathway
MNSWARFEQGGNQYFGVIEGEFATVYTGDMFDNPQASDMRFSLREITWLTPCVPSKLIAIWNNFQALAAKNNFTIPAEPLYFIKTPNSYNAHLQPIPVPAAYTGRVVYEGELGVVIGKHCKNVSAADAAEYIFGYTCINDVTASEIIFRDASFQQWTRAKSFDGFGVFGPVIAQGLDPLGLSVRTLVGGKERQNFPVADMIFKPAELVSKISQEMTLMPGDVIACGTSIGVGVLKPGSEIEVVIEGIGTLKNIYDS